MFTFQWEDQDFRKTLSRFSSAKSYIFYQLFGCVLTVFIASGFIARIYYLIYCESYSHEIPWWLHPFLIVFGVTFIAFAGLNFIFTLSLRKVAHIITAKGGEVTVETPWLEKLRFNLEDIVSISNFPTNAKEKWLTGLSHRCSHYLIELKSGDRIFLPGTIERIDELLKYLGKE